jgi:hypothetical protein
MDPVKDAIFSYDFQRFVLQDLNFRTLDCHSEALRKPFELNSPAKKEKAKEKKKGKQGDKEEGELQKPFT